MPGQGEELSEVSAPGDDGGGPDQLSLTNYSSPFVRVNWFVQCVS